MRSPISHLIFGLVAISLASCAAVPARLQLVSAAPDQMRQTIAAGCLPRQSARAIPVSTADNPGLNPERIAILNWNIYKGLRASWNSDFRNLIHQQDILILQEALLNDAFEAQLHEHKLYWTLNQSFLYGEHETGVLTAARSHPVTSCGLRITEPLLRTPKTTLIQTYRITGHPDPLMVANIHGINFTLGTETYDQQLSAITRMLEQHQGPIIFAGDFNNWSEERSAVLGRMVKTLGLEAIPYTNHNRTRVFGHAIDHIYYRGLEVLEHNTVTVTSSDHNPILVKFRLDQSRISWKSP